MMFNYIMQRTPISLTDEDRRLLDAESARTGRSLSALIRDAVSTVYGPKRDVRDDIRAIEDAFGGWTDRSFDGEQYVETLRSGRRLTEVAER